jgi:hypothetical protein
MYELLLYGIHTSDVCHTTQKDTGPAYTEVSQIPPGAFNRSWIEERE